MSLLDFAMDFSVNKPHRRAVAIKPQPDEFLGYWNLICGLDGLPGRQDMDPIDIPRMLPYVFLVDVLNKTNDFRYRLVGTDIVKNTKRDFTGALLSDIQDVGSQNELIQLYRQCVSNKAPVTGKLNFTTRGGVENHYDVAVTPLASDGQTIDMLFGFALHGDDAITS